MILVRAGNSRDLPKISHLRRASAEALRTNDKTRRQAGIETLVAEHEGQLAGFIDIGVAHQGRQCLGGPTTRFASCRYGKKMTDADRIIKPLSFGLIKDLYVLPASRNRGIGTALVQHGNDWLRQSSVNEIRATLPVGDEAPSIFLEKLKFKPLNHIWSRKLDKAQPCPDRSGIRPATLRDLDQVAGLVRQEVELQQTLARCFSLLPDVDWRNHVRAKIGRGSTAIFVLEQDGRLAGFIEARLTSGIRRRLLNRLKSARGKRGRAPVSRAGIVGAIEDLYVRPEMRNRGFATNLMQAGTHWLQTHHVGEVRAAIWTRNRLSLDFFHKAGFTLKWTIMSRAPSLQ